MAVIASSTDDCWRPAGHTGFCPALTVDGPGAGQAARGGGTPAAASVSAPPVLCLAGRHPGRSQNCEIIALLIRGLGPERRLLWPWEPRCCIQLSRRIACPRNRALHGTDRGDSAALLERAWERHVPQIGSPLLAARARGCGWNLPPRLCARQGCCVGNELVPPCPQSLGHLQLTNRLSRCLA